MKKSLESRIRQQRRSARLSDFLLAGLIALLLVSGYGNFLSTAKNTSQTKSIVYHQVQKGDTMWTIAEKYRPQDVYILEYLDTLYADNQEFKNRSLKPGDTVKVSVLQ